MSKKESNWPERDELPMEDPIGDVPELTREQIEDAIFAILNKPDMKLVEEEDEWVSGYKKWQADQEAYQKQMEPCLIYPEGKSGEVIPQNLIPCGGRLISEGDYPELYAALSVLDNVSDIHPESLVAQKLSEHGYSDLIIPNPDYVSSRELMLEAYGEIGQGIINPLVDSVKLVNKIKHFDLGFEIVKKELKCTCGTHAVHGKVPVHAHATHCDLRRDDV